MIANNVSIDQFIDLLNKIKDTGATAVNVEIKEDEIKPDTNKLVIYPVNEQGQVKDFDLFDNRVNTENNDIFNLFQGIL